MYQDIHQWYTAIHDSVEDAQKYEKLILKFGKTLKYSEKKWLDEPFMNEFYKKYPYRKRLFNICLSELKFSAIGLFLGFAIPSILFYLKGKIEIGLVIAAITAAVSFILVEVAAVFLNYLKYKSLIKKLIKQEDLLRPIMVSLPAKYRHSDKLNIIAKTYLAEKGIIPEAAFDVVDEVFPKYKTNNIYSVMFDLPFKNNFIIEESYYEGQQMAELTNEERIMENPNLPSDIKTKTFKGSENAKIDLDSMIGLASVKDQIQKLENRIKFYGNQNNGNHMQFLGSAGTGKTTVARIVTKILYDLGYIKKNQYIEISGDYLKAGDTARADAIIEYSLGSVLFIDEAYLLYDKQGYSNEAIGVLLKAMEDHREDFVVILAGYEEQMTRLIASNEGFSSRIKHTIYFPDYTEEEMLDIFKFFISNYSGNAYKLADDAVPVLLEAFKLEKQVKSFGNARTVRNAVDAIMDNYADRCMNIVDDTKTIQKSDVELYKENRKIFLQHELKNSSAANQVDESIIKLSELKSRVKEGSEDPDTDFSNMVGLDSFKKEIESLKNQKDFYGKASSQKILLLGEQSCGKSTLTKIITGYLYKLGYIQENKYLEISADLLKGSFVGHTTKRAESIISYATGGVLYIKNINLLVNSNDAFAGEALTAVNEALKSNLIVIIGDQNSQYINSIKNMFSIVYEFPKYNGEQLTQIFANRVFADEFSITEQALNKVGMLLANKTSVKDALNLYEKAKKKHIENYTEQTKYVIVDTDIERPKIKLNAK